MKRSLLLMCMLLTLSTVFVACGSKKKEKADPRWSGYVKAFTSGRISKESSIRVVFQQDVVGKADVGKDAGEFIDFSPGLSGKAEWSAGNEITFTPKKSLPSGKQYKVELDLKDKLKVPDDLKDFVFYFEVIKQDFEFSIEGLSTPDITKLSKQEFKGNISTADVADGKNVEKILGAFQDGDKLPIKWIHKSDRKAHIFVVSNVTRKKTADELTLKFDGDDIDADRDGKEKYAIPAKSEFKVLEVKAHMTKGQYIEVRFSDPLKRKQNLRGLIRLQGRGVRLSLKGNVVKVYPRKKIRGKVKLIVDSGVRNTESKKLGKAHRTVLSFESLKPGVRFVNKGTILPENEALTVPFEAVNVNSVQVTAFKIPEKNMGQFLQVNNMAGKTQLRRVGRYIWRKSIRLTSDTEQIHSWTRYHLDLTDLFKKHPGSLFQLTLSINRGNSTYNCPKDKTVPAKEKPFVNADEWKVVDSSYWDYDYYGYNNDNDNPVWTERRDPCKNAYFNVAWTKTIQSVKNVSASNIGLIAKMGEDGTIYVSSTDLRTASPVNAAITVFNYQNQELAGFSTGGSGLGRQKLETRPFYLRAKVGEDTGYLKLDGKSMLPVSHFDTGGQKLNKGVKGYIFGERGVWRPGDDMFLSFVLEDKNKLLPENHPLHLELYDPRGRLIRTVRRFRRKGNYYLFKTSTSEDAPTGNWRALVHLGGRVFSKELKVETVVPNRLKVNLEFKNKVLRRSDFPLSASLNSKWLHGADADGLKADVSVKYVSARTRFTRFKDYQFDDLTRRFHGDSGQVWSGHLSGAGNSDFSLNLNLSQDPPGLLNAVFSSRVFEKGGAFSSESFRIPFHHYTAYVGIKVPKGDAARNMLLTDKYHKVEIGSVDSKGKKISLKNVELKIYKLGWRSWWNKSNENLANFEESEHIKKIAEGEVKTSRGSGRWKFKIKYPQWGRYLLRACDGDNPDGHCSSKIIYVDWPGWAGRSRAGKGIGASTLSFTSDKSAYKVGETATIFLPQVEKGRALISIENGSRVISQRWVETEKGKNKFEIDLTEQMSPNVYVHVTLIQPHKDRKNDRPIRLYGVIPLLVSNANTVLTPILNSPGELRPMQPAVYKVKEKKGRAMSYSLAIVDEGLLGLTRYRTPDLRSEFYKREALGVRTWDLFDDVAGAYGAALRRVLAIGGGDDIEQLDNLPGRRFPPVVKVLGPFELKSGDTGSHKVTLPRYIGAVRVMVVAASPGAYGFAEKSVPVRDKLMIQPTMPRVVGPGEDLLIPVSVIANSPKVRKVKLSIKTDDFIKLQESASKTIIFKKPGEKMVYFKAKTALAVGQSKITFKSRGGGVKSDQVIHIKVRGANPATARTISASLSPGKSYKTVLVPHGLLNTNSAVLEISSIPPLNLGRRLEYLIRYPHGCVEQTVSGAFPQIYLDGLTELNKDQKHKVGVNITSAINKLRGMQASSGGFQYWPSATRVDDWSTSYVGHFLLEAKKKGFYVPESMLKSWRKYQRSTAGSWRRGSKHGDAIQAYRLFTLALAKKPALGAMNRLREKGDLSGSARWHLASAFKLAGQTEAGLKLVNGEDTFVKAYIQMAFTYGSNVRDEAVILQALTILDQKARAKELAVKLSKALAADRWYGTHTTAYTLMALAEFIGVSKSSKDFKVKSVIGGKSKTIKSDAPIFRQEILNLPKSGLEIQLENPDDDVTLFVNITSRGVPGPGEELEKSKGLSLDVSYKSTSGGGLSPAALKHGQDLIAEVRVRNTSSSLYKNLALTHITPSGWQIHNERFESGQGPAGVDFQDIRDDRVLSYFDLKPGETRVVKVKINASFKGRYYLPAILVEAMYDASIKSLRKGRWIEIK